MSNVGLVERYFKFLIEDWGFSKHNVHNINSEYSMEYRLAEKDIGVDIDFDTSACWVIVEIIRLKEGDFPKSWGYYVDDKGKPCRKHLSAILHEYGIKKMPILSNRERKRQIRKRQKMLRSISDEESVTIFIASLEEESSLLEENLEFIIQNKEEIFKVKEKEVKHRKLP